jgi:hypothetical protein
VSVLAQYTAPRRPGSSNAIICFWRSNFALINDFAGGGGDQHPAGFISDVNIWDA